MIGNIDSMPNIHSFIRIQNIMLGIERERDIGVIENIFLLKLKVIFLEIFFMEFIVGIYMIVPT